MIESTQELNAKNNPRDYGLKNPIKDPLLKQTPLVFPHHSIISIVSRGLLGRKNDVEPRISKKGRLLTRADHKISKCTLFLQSTTFTIRNCTCSVM